MAVQGILAHVAQQAWILNATLFSFLWTRDIKGRSDPVGVWPGLCPGSICQHGVALPAAC